MNEVEFVELMKSLFTTYPAVSILNTRGATGLRFSSFLKALHYQASSQAKPRLDFEVQASSLIQAFAEIKLFLMAQVDKPF